MDRAVSTGRAVLVTGASRGIGRAAAQAFAAQGDRVALHYRERAGLAGDILRTSPTRPRSGRWWTPPPTSSAGWTWW